MNEVDRFMIEIIKEEINSAVSIGFEVDDDFINSVIEKTMKSDNIEEYRAEIIKHLREEKLKRILNG